MVNIEPNIALYIPHVSNGILLAELRKDPVNE
jgi:hypothetical protein